MAKGKKRKYIELCFEQILQQKGVLNAFVFDLNGVPRQSTIEEMETIRHIGLIQEIIIKSKRALQTLDHNNELQNLRVRSRKFEILISKDDDLYFVVYQNAAGRCEMNTLSFFSFDAQNIFHCLQICIDDGWLLVPYASREIVDSIRPLNSVKNHFQIVSGTECTRELI